MKTWPLVRHLRWYVYQWRNDTWWLKIGQFVGGQLVPYDPDWLDAVWRGEA